jgi:branched-chain amino acid transport system permease protein
MTAAIIARIVCEFVLMNNYHGKCDGYRMRRMRRELTRGVFSLGYIDAAQPAYIGKILGAMTERSEQRANIFADWRRMYALNGGGSVPSIIGMLGDETNIFARVTLVRAEILAPVFLVVSFAGVYAHKWLLPITAGLPPILSTLLVLLAGMAFCGFLGILIEWLAYRPLRKRTRLAVLITAIGVSLFLSYSAQLVFGAAPQPFPSLIENKTHQLGDFGSVTTKQIVILSFTIFLLWALRFIVLKTRMGLAMRALSNNPTAASLMGVDTNAVISFTFGLGSALAGAGGMFFAILYQAIDPFMGILPGIKAFVAAVLGGIGNIPGAALGGLLIGLMETLVVGYSSNFGIPSGYRDAVAFVILIAILLFILGWVLSSIIAKAFEQKPEKELPLGLQ